MGQQLLGECLLMHDAEICIREPAFAGSMMGSTQDLKDATDFLSEHRIVPVVSHVLDGLEAAEEGFELMERGDQFGKIVIQLSDQAQNARSKL